ncbi:MAG: hypothetical protein M3495_16450 [Pseudomonadota bacterium]|nr:hypothetical protein [Pseudomonadota bacterium]
MYSLALSAGSLIVPGPLLTKKSPSATDSIPFHFRNTGSGLLWQLTTHTVLPSTICVFGSMHVPARSAVASDLCQMAHELVVVLDLVALDAHDRAIVGHANQEIAALGIQDAAMVLSTAWVTNLVVLPSLFDVPTKSRLELQCLRLAALDQLFGIAVGAQVLVKEEVLIASPKARSSVMRL